MKDRKNQPPTHNEIKLQADAPADLPLANEHREVRTREDVA
jgi:hypothetical protein